VYRFALSVFTKKIYLVYFLIAFFGLVYVTVSPNKTSIGFYLSGIIWLLLYTAFFLNIDRIHSLFYLNTKGVIFWIFIFSISISLLMLEQISKKELQQRKNYAEKLSTQNDEANAKLVNMGTKLLDADFFSKNFQYLYNEETNRKLRDSIEKNNYIGYQNRFNTSIYFFDNTGKPLFNPGNFSLNTLNEIMNKQAIPTDIESLYFYETQNDKFFYISQKKIIDSGVLKGTAFIISEPKKFGNLGHTNTELFKQYGEWEISNSSVYYYAVYKNKLLVSTSQKYPFTTTLIPSEMPQQMLELREKNGFSELWYMANSNTVVVMARRSEALSEAITLFSYILLSFLLIIVFVRFFLFVISFVSGSRFIRYRYLFRSSLRGQIHNTFIFITILSFLVVGVASMLFFVNRFQIANSERLGRVMKTMLNELQTHPDLPNIVHDERFSGDTVNSSVALSQIIRKVSDIHGVDVNIYDVTGKLLATSQPDIYMRGVLSNRMGLREYYNLVKLRSVEYIQKEQISSLSFYSIYAPVRDDNGAFYAYLGIPYFISQNQLNQEISSFLVTLINLNAFIFLIMGMVALFITNRITISFQHIGEKMTEVSLSKNNELIEWNRSDEIGSLVKEYNKMVEKLQESANELALAERQGAWQEMARQVAHEIKNPLTPMKLSLQYLQRAIDENRPNIETLAANVSTTLVEQIDHLSKIASDFSQFANIGTVHKEVFDLHQTLSQLNELHSNNRDILFIWEPINEKIRIYADKTQINRLFTNLISNAIDASSENAQAIISIHERLDENSVIIGVEDNGAGIYNDMLHKIFVPNFTTKTSGTGLGLAMSKAIVEQSEGNIWFETKVGKGTIFYVKLPLVRY
jgi:signal transduction histidine kinase